MAARGKIFLGPCEFMLGVVRVEDLPPSDLPEIAFAGRSNVGKSSLLNALTQRKIAKTSGTPGHTQQVNFFRLDEKMYLVDLPGYGYAKAPKEVVKKWTGLIRQYLVGRPNLSRVCLLIDARHGVKKNDREIMKMLDEAAVSYQIILTKTDKVRPTHLEKITQDIEALGTEFIALHPQTVLTSARDAGGIEELRDVLATFVK